MSPMLMIFSLILIYGHIPSSVAYICEYTGPNYSELGSLENKDYIADTNTYDTLRGRNNGFPLNVNWVDRFNQRHTVKIWSRYQQCTSMFPCGNKGVEWHHGGGRDRTGFDAQVTWCLVKFSYTGGSWGNNHGIRINLSGYTKASTGFRDVDWARVQQLLNAGKTIAEIIQILRSKRRDLDTEDEMVRLVRLIQGKMTDPAASDGDMDERFEDPDTTFMEKQDVNQLEDERNLDEKSTDALAKLVKLLGKSNAEEDEGGEDDESYAKDAE